MSGRDNSDDPAKLTADIVIAYLGGSSVQPDQLPGLIRQVRAALREAEAPEPSGETTVVTRDMTIEASITAEFLISFENGKKYRSLKRHLMARYGMTPDDYRRKWGLPADYPMVAPQYAQTRSQVAKRTGLGKRRSDP